MDYPAMMRITLLLMSFLLALPVQAEVYRSVDENGNIIFSDQPSEGAEEIKLDKIQTVDSPTVKPSAGSTGTGRNPDEEKGYQALTIASPANDTTISANDGNVAVQVSITPALQTRQGHKLVLYLDGSEVERQASPQFQLTNLDRGTHSLAVAVVDNKGLEVKRSDSVSFTVQRHSVQHKQSTVGRPQGGSPPGPTGGAPAPSP